MGPQLGAFATDALALNSAFSETLKLFNLTSRAAGPDLSAWNRLCHNRPSTHDRPVPNIDTLEDHAIRTQPDISAKGYRLHFVGLLFHRNTGVGSVVMIDKDAPRRDESFVSDVKSSDDIELGTASDEHVVANAN